MSLRVLRSVLGLLVALSATPCMSASQWCYGTISAAWVHANGEFFILPSWRGDHIRVCSTTTTLADSGSSISPTVCLGWLSTVRLAMAAGKSTVMYFPEAPACNLMPTYSGAPLPIYIMVQSV